MKLTSIIAAGNPYANKGFAALAEYLDVVLRLVGAGRPFQYTR
jgi:hypothetical protein